MATKAFVTDAVKEKRLSPHQIPSQSLRQRNCEGHGSRQYPYLTYMLAQLSRTDATAMPMLPT
jgi:hypothetical protein